MIDVKGITTILLACCALGVSSSTLHSRGNRECKPRTYPQNSTLTPVDLPSQISELRWLSGGNTTEADKYVFVITSAIGFEAGGEVYRSDYYGSHESWKNITGDLPGLMEGGNGTRGFLRGALTLHNSREAPEKIFIQGAGRHNWVSSDFGAGWKRVDTPGKTLGYWTKMEMHPFQPDWMLALVRRHECSLEGSALDKWCASDLFVTQDFGDTWRNLTDSSKGRIASFVDFGWGAFLRPWQEWRERPADTTIFATAYEDAHHMKGPLPSWDQHVHYVMSTDFFETAHEKIASCGNKFDIVSHRVYLAVPSDCPFHPDGTKRKLTAGESVSQSVLMYVSGDEGTSFTEACIPVGDLDRGYSLQHNFFEEGAFLLTHGSQDQATAQAPVANVYSAGVNSSLFSLSLPRVFQRGKRADFVNVEGLPGIYIANFLGLNALEDTAFRYDTEAADYEKYLKSMVSYNGGAHWNLLTKPDSVNHPSCDSCSQLNSSWECQLHLHGPSSWHSTQGKMPQMHTHMSAPGLVMAVGNIGQNLDFAADITCTFLSRDGGESWEDIADHSNVFEFGDSGGILAMVRHQTHGPAEHMQFSMDEGRCWHTVNFSQAINVVGIKVEPTAASNVFLVYGEACQKSDRHPTCSHEEEGAAPLGKMYAINFHDLMGDDWKNRSRRLEGAPNPEGSCPPITLPFVKAEQRSEICEEDAYETYSVPTPERCLLGRNVSMTRRKADSACFNGKGWQRPHGWNVSCDCDWVDVECEFGFEWSWGRRECVAMAGVDPHTCAVVREKKYIMSQSHLRLVNADHCANISLVINDTDGRGHSTLPPRGFHLPGWAIVILALLVAVAVVAGAAAYLQRQNPSSDSYESSGVIASVGDAFYWIKSKISGLGGGSNRDDSYFQPLSGSNEEFGVDDEDAHSPVQRA